MKQKCIVCAKKLSAILVALCLTVSMMFSALATGSTANQSVLEDKTGIVQVKLVYIDPDTKAETPIQSGSGFLINDTNVITCDHVVTMTKDTLADAAEYLEKSETVVQNNSVIQIVYLRDTTPITATVSISSGDMDFAVLTMNSQLYSRTYLSLRSSSTVVQSESVYAMGFPALVEKFQDVNTFDSEDITINDGRVSKLNTNNGVDYVQCSATFTEGMSGGPLVDEDGCVVGIIQSGTGENFDTEYYYAVAIDQVITAMDDRGIEYTSCTHDGTIDETNTDTDTDTETGTETEVEPEDETEAEVTVDKTTLQSLVTKGNEEDTSKYTNESADALASALSTAQTVLNDDSATQTTVDDAASALQTAIDGLEPKPDNTMMFIIIGVVAAVVVILVVVILVLTRKKKGNTPNGSEYEYYPTEGSTTPTAPQQTPVASAVGSTASVYGGSNETSVLNAGAGETSVLNAGAGETSVLSQNYGSLTRSKTGEKVNINAASFIIGKEQSRVNYCVRDNSSVSRTHATITSRNGAAYITDMRTTNGTFVNGVRLTPNKETQLKDGDTILLADEEFTYHTL